MLNILISHSWLFEVNDSKVHCIIQSDEQWDVWTWNLGERGEQHEMKRNFSWCSPPHVLPSFIKVVRVIVESHMTF